MLAGIQLFETLKTVAHQAPPSMGFSRQEYWSGLPLPSPGDLPDPGIEPWSPTLQADALTSEPSGKPKLIRLPESIGLCLGQLCNFSAVRSSNVFGHGRPSLLLGLRTPLWFQSFRHQQGGERCLAWAAAPLWALGGPEGPVTDGTRLCGPLINLPFPFKLTHVSFHSLVLNDS